MTVRDGSAAAARARLAVAVAALVALVLAAFSPALRADFVRIDDPAYVTANPRVLRGLTAEGLTWALTSTGLAANWHPLTWVAHMADVTLFGLRPGAHHAVNVALHALAASLLLVALAQATGKLLPAFLAAALFALHPLRVESVAWVSQRKDVLAGLFLSLTLLAHLRLARAPGPLRQLTVAAVFALGLMAKQTLVTLPFALLLLDWWPLGRFRAGAAGPGGAVPRPLGPVVEKLPLLALSAAAAALALAAQGRGGALRTGAVFPLADRLANALHACGWYLGRTLWPHGLIPFHPHRGSTLAPGELVAAGALLAAISAAAWVRRTRQPWIAAGWLWYLGTLVPVLGFVQIGLQGVAERYAYVPAIGLSLALAGQAGAAGARRARALAPAVAVSVAVLALLSWRQAGFWKDTATLFSHTTALDPRNYVALHLLGTDHLERGEPAAAVPLFGRALAIKPDYAPARYNLALALAADGRKDEAVEQFSLLLLVDPRDGESLYNRGRLLLEQRRAEEALRDLDAALAVSPGQPEVLAARRRALAALGGGARPTPEP